MCQITVVKLQILYFSLDVQVPLVFPNPHPEVEVGLLWIELLRFYSLEFLIADNIISVRTNAILSREMRDWPKKRIAVEGQKQSRIFFLCINVLDWFKGKNSFIATC